MLLGNLDCRRWHGFATGSQMPSYHFCDRGHYVENEDDVGNQAFAALLLVIIIYWSCISDVKAKHKTE